MNMSIFKDESYESIEELLEEPIEESQVEESQVEEHIEEEEYSNHFDNTASTTTREIDDLTLSLLMNKTLYKKYISKNEDSTNEYEEQRVLDNRKYRSKILDITAQMIDSPDLEISYDINKIFLTYTTKIIHYLKMKEVEKQNQYNFYNKEEEEDDVLFGSMVNTDSSYDQPTIASLWSKERIVKNGNVPIANYDMRMFSKR
jgi:hypothetical protein